MRFHRESISKFFDRYQRDIRRGLRILPAELDQPRFGEIWKTNLPIDTYVRIQTLAYRGDETVVVFNRCDENGLFVSLRTGSGEDEVIVKQPSFMPMPQFISQFHKYKAL